MEVEVVVGGGYVPLGKMGSEYPRRCTRHAHVLRFGHLLKRDKTPRTQVSTYLEPVAFGAGACTRAERIHVLRQALTENTKAALRLQVHLFQARAPDLRRSGSFHY